MCNYSVKQQNPGSASFLAALCSGPKEIHLPGEFRESVPGWAGGVRHGRRLMGLISRAGLFFSWLSVSICQWIRVLTLTTALEEPAPPGLVAACWWEGRGQGCKRVKCPQGRLEAMQKWNGARFRCLQPKHFQSRINNTTFQFFAMKNNQLCVSKQFPKNNTNAGRAPKLFYKCWAYIWNPFAKSFLRAISCIPVMAALAGPWQTNISEGQLGMCQQWRAMSAWGTPISLAFLTPSDPKGSH